MKFVTGFAAVDVIRQNMTKNGCSEDHIQEAVENFNFLMLTENPNAQVAIL